MSMLGNDIVAVPFTGPSAHSETSTPAIVMVGALDVGVTPATAMAPNGSAVKEWPWVVKTEDGVSGSLVGRMRGIVDGPATKPAAP